MKTVGTLTLNSKVYLPSVEFIITNEVVEIKGTDDGVEIRLNKYRTCKVAPFISRTFKDKYDRVYYVNKEDAIEEQQSIRVNKLARLKENMQKANEEYFEFVEKYFSPKINEL